MCHGFLQKLLSDPAGASHSSHFGRKPLGAGRSHFISTTKVFIRGKCLKAAFPPLPGPLPSPASATGFSWKAVAPGGISRAFLHLTGKGMNSASCCIPKGCLDESLIFTH